MEVLNLKGKIENDGHLRIDIPTGLKPGNIQIVLVLSNEHEEKSRYDFSDLSGKLTWQGDGVSVQRSLRNEW